MEPSTSDEPVLSQILGELIDSAGGKHTSAELVDKEVVALYFGGKWSVPCQNFTPKLLETYNKCKEEGKAFQVVYVSMDQNEEQFNGAFKEAGLPWLAVPYENKSRRQQLNAAFRVRTLPTLVMLDGKGNLVRPDGQIAISSVREEFPWKPRTIAEVLASSIDVYNTPAAEEGGELGTIEKDAVEGKVLGLYVSIASHPLCQKMNLKLAEHYTELLAGGLTGFEMVFISLDKTEEAFLDFYKSMPWLAVPYANTEARDGLIKALGVTSAPGLYIVGSDGVVINPTGLKPFMSDKTGDGFPWHPPPYCELMLAQEAVNEEPTLIAFVEGCSKDVSEEVERALKAVATQEAEVSAVTKKKLVFAIAKVNDPLAPQVRSVTGLGDPSVDPVVVILNLREAQSFFKADAAPTYTVDSLKTFIAGWREGKAAGEKLDIEAAQKRAQERSMAREKEKAKVHAEENARLKTIILQLQAAAQAGDPTAAKQLQSVFTALQEKGMSPQMIQQMLVSGGPGGAAPDAPGTRAAGGAVAGVGAAAGGKPSVAQTVGKLLAAATTGGNSKAQRDMAMAYAKGIPEAGLPKDVKKAAEFAKMAIKTMAPNAESSDAKAQEVLADCYNLLQMHGDAVMWYKKAAEAGNHSAEYNLGLMMQAGDGAAKDVAGAAEIFRRLARVGEGNVDDFTKKNATSALRDPEIAEALKTVEFYEDLVMFAGVGVTAALVAGAVYYYRK